MRTNDKVAAFLIVYGMAYAAVLAMRAVTVIALAGGALWAAIAIGNSL
jgi:hypothetical protein